TSICERRNSGVTIWPGSRASHSLKISSGGSMASSRVLRSTSRYSSSIPMVNVGSRMLIPHPSPFRAISAGLDPDQRQPVQRIRHDRSPALRPLMGVDQILANLDGDMRQAALRAMLIHRIAERLARRIGLVIADDKGAVLAKDLQKRRGKARILIPEHADMPRPFKVVHDRREAVHGEKDGRCPRRFLFLDQLEKRAVIGIKPA